MYSVSGAFIVCIAVALLKRYLTPSSLPLPPGPKPLPVIGNITHISRNAPLWKMKKWTDIFGPIVTLKVGSRTVILLGSHAVARDLLEKRLSLCGSRPRMIFLNEYLMKGLFSAAMPYDDRYRAIVRMRAPLFNPKSVKAAACLLPASTAYCLYDMGNGDELFDHTLMVFVRTFFPFLYGTHLDAFGTEHVEDVKALLALIGAGISPDSTAIDAFTILEYVPGVTWALKRKATAILEPVLSRIRARINKALARPSWNAIQAIYERWPADMTFDEFCISMMELIITPATTSFTICDAIRMTLQHPDELERIQAEMDRVIGTGRLPNSDDLQNMPFLNGFIQESTRLRGLSPLSLPHTPLRDDEYMGYRIPKGSLVFTFQYGMNLDESIFENPTSFDPTRWIKDPTLPKPSHFGFGKRACPGKPFVTDTVLLATARTLWGYNFHIQEDAQVHKFVDNMAFHLDSAADIIYTCKSDAHRALIEQAYKEAEVNPEVALREIRALF